MLLPLLLQLAPLLPPSMELPPADLTDLNVLQGVVSITPWPREDLENWHPDTAKENRDLAAMVRLADLTTLRFLALAGAGVAGDSPMGIALFRAGCQQLPEAEAIACLLAPTAPNRESALALADLASRRDRSLPVRAAALGRLLEAGYAGAWPLAKAMLLCGTAQDSTATPLADWVRGGRYELPKRLLLSSLRQILPVEVADAITFEPNSSWEAQETALRALEDAVLPLLGAMPLESPVAIETLSERQKAAVALVQ